MNNNIPNINYNINNNSLFQLIKQTIQTQLKTNLYTLDWVKIIKLNNINNTVDLQSLYNIQKTSGEEVKQLYYGVDVVNPLHIKTKIQEGDWGVVFFLKNNFSKRFFLPLFINFNIENDVVNINGSVLIDQQLEVKNKIISNSYENKNGNAKINEQGEIEITNIKMNQQPGASGVLIDSGGKTLATVLNGVIVEIM